MDEHQYSRPTVTIPALPIGNHGAVANMVRKCGGEPILASSPSELYSAQRIILTGIGSFDAGMRALEVGEWLKPLHQIARANIVPILGICLGMQLMCRRSEEGSLPGLGWFEADVKRIKAESLTLKVPHMGWNTIEVKRPNELIVDSSEERRFYFVHSYHVVCDTPTDIVAITSYGVQLTAAISRQRLFGTQFHPEKSHRFGTELMRHFLELAAQSR